MSAFKTGKRTPSPEARQQIHAAVGIPPEAWDQPAPTEAPDPPDAPSKHPRATPEAVQAQADELLADVHALRARVMREDMDPATQARAMGNIADTLSALGKLTGQSYLSERQVLLSPAFRNLVELILGVLKDHPIALRAMADFFESRTNPKPVPTISNSTITIST